MTAPLMESGTYATRPDGSRWTRVAMHGDGWSGRGHELTCPRCGWSTSRRYLKDAETAHAQHACVVTDLVPLEAS